MPHNLSWGDSRLYAVLQRTLDKDCRQAEEPKQLVEASRFHLGRQCQTANTLWSSALVLCYPAAEYCHYCAPVWSLSAHTSRVDVQLNSTMRLISGTLRSTPLPWLPVLSKRGSMLATLNRQPYEGRLPLISWWSKSSNMTVGQSSLISLTHHCYD